MCSGIGCLIPVKLLQTKHLVMIMPIGLFVASGFEHCVANMFMIPLGIITAHFSTPEFWQQNWCGSNEICRLRSLSFIVKNLIPVTLGNIVGGAVCISLFQRYLTKAH